MKINRRGFTLFELITAMSVALVVALVAYSFVENAVSIWKRADSNMAIESEVNAALDLLQQDIESAVFREGFGTMFAVDVLSTNANSGRWVGGATKEKPAGGANAPATHQYGLAGHWVRFYTAAPTLNAVAYQLIRSRWMSNATEPRYRLYRSTVRQDLTVDSGLDILAAPYSTAGAPIQNNPIEVISPDLVNIVLNNVVDFGVRLYVYDGNINYGGGVDRSDGIPYGMRLIFPASSNSLLSASDTAHLGATSRGTNWNSRFPEAVEIVVRVLTADGAKLLHDLEEGGGSPSDTDWQNIVSSNRNSRVYRRFVEVRSRSL